MPKALDKLSGHTAVEQDHVSWKLALGRRKLNYI